MTFILQAVCACLMDVFLRLEKYFRWVLGNAVSGGIQKILIYKEEFVCCARVRSGFRQAAQYPE